MKKVRLTIIGVVGLMVFGIQGYAKAATCGLLKTGLYEVQSKKTAVIQNAPEFWMEENQISIFKHQNFSNDVLVEVRNPEGDVLGSDRGDYVVDGKTHFLSWDPEADNYFVNYTAKCHSGRMVISQNGADNDAQMKRVSTYHEKMIVTPSSEKLVSVVIHRVVYSTQGKQLYKARTKIILKKRT